MISKAECFKLLGSLGRSNYVGLLPLSLLGGLIVGVFESSFRYNMYGGKKLDNAHQAEQVWTTERPDRRVKSKFGAPILFSTILYTTPYIVSWVHNSTLSLGAKVPVYAGIGMVATYSMLYSVIAFFQLPDVLKKVVGSRNSKKGKTGLDEAQDALVAPLVCNSIALVLGTIAARTDEHTFQLAHTFGPVIPLTLLIGMICTEFMKAFNLYSWVATPAPTPTIREGVQGVILHHVRRDHKAENKYCVGYIAASLAAFFAASYAGFRLQHIPTSTKFGIAFGVLCCTTLASYSSLYVDKQVQKHLSEGRKIESPKGVHTLLLASPLIITSLFLSEAFGSAIAPEWVNTTARWDPLKIV